ncbi:hypothetical protein B0H13DRAFT_1616253 [Mycena leptocephala]|nr:hypothetical protein B0H13DRAFT_1616253 [Mycena leptocephala]
MGFLSDTVTFGEETARGGQGVGPACAEIHARNRQRDAFGEQWWAWWIDINPAWRQTALPMSRDGDGSWTSLDFAGPNGFLNVLMCLKWWFDKDGGTKRWKEGVEDVKWVLRKMIG